MENKMFRYNKKQFLIGLGGFFLGTVIFGLFGGEVMAYRLLAGLVTAGILKMLSDLNDFKKHPKLKKQISIEDKDERNQVIREKAGYVTLKVTFAILLVIVFTGAIMEDRFISYGAAGLSVAILTINWSSIHYWNKKM